MEEKLRVVFAISGNLKEVSVNPFIQAQGDSLRKEGIDVRYFLIKGKGIMGYLKSIQHFRKYLNEFNPNIIHAHYVLSGWVAVLSFPSQPVVLSLLGSDVNGVYIDERKRRLISILLMLLSFLIQPFVKKIIAKSENIASGIYLKRKLLILPNGVSFRNFYQSEVINYNELKLVQGKNYILFLGNPQDKQKNVNLALKAIDLLHDDTVELCAPYYISHSKVPRFINASACLIVCSFMEGSSNVLKEAMACNIPVISTRVGDAEMLFGDEPGHFLISFEPYDVAEKIRLAISFRKMHGYTKGRERLKCLKLDESSVALKLIEGYKTIYDNKNISL